MCLTPVMCGFLFPTLPLKLLLLTEVGLVLSERGPENKLLCVLGSQRGLSEAPAQRRFHVHKHRSGACYFPSGATHTHIFKDGSIPRSFITSPHWNYRSHVPVREGGRKTPIPLTLPPFLKAFHRLFLFLFRSYEQRQAFGVSR